VRTKRRGPDEQEQHAHTPQAPGATGVAALGEPALDRWGQAGPAARAASIGALQASAGNQAVMAMMAAGNAPAALPPRPAGATSVERHSFQATIRRVDATAVPPPAPVLTGGSPDDKYEAHPTTPGAIPVPEAPAAPAGAPAAGSAAAAPAAAAPGPEASAEPAVAGKGDAPAEGTVVSLPDVIVPELALVQVCDAITGAISYKGLVEATATPGPTQFGICNFGDVRLTGQTVTYEKSAYKVAGTFENHITWGVHPTTDNETDISSATDADITKTNYPKVADDLTPNVGSSGGRPPRSKFWAKDLTEIHEKFHAEDVKGQGPAAATAAVAWLNAQTAGTVIGVAAVTSQLPARVVQTLIAGMGEPAEVRAYGGGAAAYTARAADIRKRGAAGEYK
jgi:hypothetical protein